MAAERLLRFNLGPESFALRLRDAGSLVNLPEASPVPLAPEEIVGVVDVRGRVVTIVSLPRLLEMPDHRPGTRRALLLAAPWEHLGVEVGEEVDLLTTDLESEPASPRSGRDASPVTGVLTTEGILLNLIDPAAVAAACERRVRERFRLAG